MTMGKILQVSTARQPILTRISSLCSIDRAV